MLYKIVVKWLSEVIQWDDLVIVVLCTHRLRESRLIFVCVMGKELRWILNGKNIFTGPLFVCVHVCVDVYVSNSGGEKTATEKT